MASIQYNSTACSCLNDFIGGFHNFIGDFQILLANWKFRALFSTIRVSFHLKDALIEVKMLA